MFKFTIRDLLWLTVVVALAIGWYVDRSHQAGLAASWESDFRKAVDLVNTEMAEAAMREAILQQKLDNRTTPPNLSAPAPNLPSD